MSERACLSSLNMQICRFFSRSLGTPIHLILKGRSINYPFICVLINPLFLIFNTEFKILLCLIHVNEDLRFGIRCITIGKSTTAAGRIKFATERHFVSVQKYGGGDFKWKQPLILNLNFTCTFER